MDSLRELPEKSKILRPVVGTNIHCLLAVTAVLGIPNIRGVYTTVPRHTAKSCTWVTACNHLRGPVT